MNTNKPLLWLLGGLGILLVVLGAVLIVAQSQNLRTQVATSEPLPYTEPVPPPTYTEPASTTTPLEVLYFQAESSVVGSGTISSDGFLSLLNVLGAPRALAQTPFTKWDPKKAQLILINSTSRRVTFRVTLQAGGDAGGIEGTIERKVDPIAISTVQDVPPSNVLWRVLEERNNVNKTVTVQAGRFYVLGIHPRN